MNDQERLKAFLDRAANVESLDQPRFDRLIAELERPQTVEGYDEDGCLKVAMFDARSCDIQSFERRNDGRLAILTSVQLADCVLGCRCALSRVIQWSVVRISGDVPCFLSSIGEDPHDGRRK
jgi:hypothetical protein